MSAENFLDTNVLVYTFDETDPDKRRQAETLVNESLASGNGCVSFQVVQETLHVLIRRLRFVPEDARRTLEQILVPLWQVNPTASLYQSAIALQGRYGFSFYDALIVAAALEAGCVRLYSEDLQHGQQIQRLTILNPFINQ
jgi:predicted nucleic acid-binding protein